MAIACGRDLDPSRVSLYCKALEDIGEIQLRYAFEQALKYIGDSIPTIKEIRRLSEEWRPAQTERVQDCPDVERVRQMLKDREIIDFPWLADPRRDKEPTPQNVAMWKAEGQNRTLAHLAELEKDPKFREERRLSKIIPGMAAKSMPSAIPSELAERVPWARQTARTLGWITDAREPGEEG